MNKSRRKRIEQAIAILEEVKEEEQEAFDNMPAQWKDGERGEAMESAISYLDEAVASAQSAVDGE